MARIDGQLRLSERHSFPSSALEDRTSPAPRLSQRSPRGGEARRGVAVEPVAVAAVAAGGARLGVPPRSLARRAGASRGRAPDASADADSEALWERYPGW